MMVVETLLLARPLAIDPACTFGAEELADAVVSTGPLASSACIVALKAPVKPVIENLIWNAADQLMLDKAEEQIKVRTYFPEVYVLFFALEYMRIK